MQNNTEQLKVKSCGKIYRVNANQMKCDPALLILDKIDFEKKIMAKQDPYLMVIDQLLSYIQLYF